MPAQPHTIIKEFIIDNNINQPYTYRMQAVQAHASLYSRITQVWDARLPQIDRQIAAFYRGARETGSGLPLLQARIANWLSRQALEAPVRAELQLLEQDSDHFQAQVQARIDFLRDAGQLGNPELSPLVSPKLQRRRSAAAPGLAAMSAESQ